MYLWFFNPGRKTMSLFSMDDFNEANKAGGGAFADIESGTYTLELEQVNLKDTKNGAIQVSFGWSIVPGENANNEGQWIWENQTLKNTDGGVNHIGINWLHKRCMYLSEGTWEPEEFLKDEEANLQRFVDTKAICAVKRIKSRDPQYDDSYQVKPRTIKENAYNNGQRPAPDIKGQQQRVEKEKQLQKAEEETVELRIGYTVVFVKDGVKAQGVIESVFEEGNVQMLKIKMPDGKSTAIHLADVKGVVKELLPQEVQEEIETPPSGETDDLDLDMDDLDEDELPQLQIGATVEFQFKGEKYTGKVLEIDEDSGKARVKFMYKGKQATGSIPIDKLTVTIPF